MAHSVAATVRSGLQLYWYGIEPYLGALSRSLVADEDRKADRDGPARTGTAHEKADNRLSLIRAQPYVVDR
jgi:hypothetical protein